MLAALYVDSLINKFKLMRLHRFMIWVIFCSHCGNKLMIFLLFLKIFSSIQRQKFIIKYEN